MQVTLSEHIEQLLQKHIALGLGRSPEEVIELALVALDDQTPVSGDEQTRREQTVDAMLAFAQQHGATLGGIRLRDLIHEDHNY